MTEPPPFRPVLVNGSKMLLVGEAPGEREEAMGQPFVGPAGRELDRMLEEVGLQRYQVSLTNVFHTRPRNNNLDFWGLSRKEAAALVQPNLPTAEIRVKKGVIDPRILQPALERLYGEIRALDPNVIVPLGNTALAAVCRVNGITTHRGVVRETEILGRTYKVLPTYHPAAVLRTYAFRPIAIADLYKAKSESEQRDFHFVPRRVLVEPTLSDLAEWESELLSAEKLAFDIETALGQITCIGFAPSIDISYVIPFWFNNQNYWPTAEEEVAALLVVKRILEGPSIKIAQNGLYDVQYLLRYGITPRNFLHDTMLLHHSLYPALPKSLGFIGSIHCNVPAWKAWRRRAKDELKRDE